MSYIYSLNILILLLCNIVGLTYGINSTCYLTNVTDISIYRNYIAGTIALQYTDNIITFVYDMNGEWNISNSTIEIMAYNNNTPIWQNSLYNEIYNEARNEYIYTNYQDPYNNNLVLTIIIPNIDYDPIETYISYTIWLYTRGPLQTNGGTIIYDTNHYGISGGYFNYNLYKCPMISTSELSSTIDIGTDDVLEACSISLIDKYSFIKKYLILWFIIFGK
jgi:hypothetical protein